MLLPNFLIISQSFVYILSKIDVLSSRIKKLWTLFEIKSMINSSKTYVSEFSKLSSDNKLIDIESHCCEEK